MENHMPLRHLSDANPDGTVLGQSASDKIAFYNATPIAQRSGAAQAVVGTAGATYSQAEINAIVTLVNEMRATLVALGLMKGTA